MLLPLRITTVILFFISLLGCSSFEEGNKHINRETASSAVPTPQEIQNIQFVMQVSSASIPTDYQFMLEQRGIQSPDEVFLEDTIMYRDLISAMSYAPTAEQRLKGLRLVEDFLTHFIQKKSVFGVDSAKMSVRGLLTKTSEKASAYSAADIKKFRTEIETQKPKNQIGSFAKNICGPTPQVSCVNAVKLTGDNMASIKLPSYAIVGMVRQWGVLSTDPVFGQAASMLALKVLSRVDESVKNPTATLQGNLFSDTVEVFKTLQPQGNSEDNAIQLLGLYGTRGPDILALFYQDWKADKPSLIHAFNFHFYAALEIVASAVNYLDAVSFASGHPYSVPSEVVSHVNSTGPYHFWMAAALTRALVNKGYSSATAFDALTRIGSAYEIQADVRSKDQGSLDLKNRYASYNIEVNKNVSLNTAGGIWAVRTNCPRANSVIIDHDRLFSDMFTNPPKDAFKSPDQIFRYKLFEGFFGRVTGLNQRILDFANGIQLFVPQEDGLQFIHNYCDK